MSNQKTALTDEKRARILRDYGFSPKTRGLFLMNLSDPDIEAFLELAGKSLGLAFISSKQYSAEPPLGFDAYISDYSSEKELSSLMHLAITPIILKSPEIISHLTEFDPMKFTGNAFLFESIDRFQILEKVIRYLENVRYPGDKKTLITNVIKSFS